MLTPDMQAVLKAEVANDPCGRGYAGKSAADIAALLNANYTVPGPVITMPPRINLIMTGQPGAPNAITPDDVTAATDIS
jgi:hypothetical protein